MPWQVLAPGTRGPKPTALVTVTKTGTISWPEAVWAMLGQCSHVRLLHDAETRRMAIVPASPDDPDAFAVIRAGKGQKRCVIWTTAALKRAGLCPVAAYRTTAEPAPDIGGIAFDAPPPDAREE